MTAERPPRGPRTLLGFDFGTRYIGVAVGQELTGTAQALTALPTRDGGPDWDAITRLVEEWQPQAFVVGLPLNMDDTEQPLTQAARRFGNRLQGRYNCPVYLVDERLTSVEARQRLAEQRRGRRTKQNVDRLAAELILRTWLEQQGA
ncbi:Holliday junction resolvase RuvX [Ectothiorhodospiraceae bacterium 2226]|nr:Holliday junction resolvase RuvX [Ectothiorhodospiraceae bacterium 2226]